MISFLNITLSFSVRVDHHEFNILLLDWLHISVVTLRGDLVIGGIGLGSHLLSNQVLELLHVFWLNWINSIHDIPEYFFSARWCGKGSCVYESVVGGS